MRPRRDDDIGTLVVAGIVCLDFNVSPVHQLADTSGQLTRRQLPFPAQLQDPPTQMGNQEGLDQHDRQGDSPQPDRLHHDEDHGGDGLPAQKGGADEGIADKPAERLDLVFDHGRRLGLLHLAHLQNGEAQQAVGQLDSAGAAACARPCAPWPC